MTLGLRREVATKVVLQLLLEEGLNVRAMAARLGIAERSVQRALVRHGLVEPHERYVLTFEQAARIEILLGEGMPMTWVAEDVQLPLNILRHRVPVPIEVAREWQLSWGSIVRRPELYELHRQFAPSHTPETWAEMAS